MMPFSYISEAFRCFLGIWAMFLLWGAVLIFALDFKIKRKLPLWAKRILYSVFVVILYLNSQCILEVGNEELVNSFLISMVSMYEALPVASVVAFYGFCTILIVALVVVNIFWNKTHITDSSVKDAVDTLPLGILCYDEYGKITFKNIIMDALCRELTGTSLLSGTDFASIVFSKTEIEESDELTESDRIIRILANERAWCFYKSQISDGNEEYSMLNAVDISEEYQKTRMLENQKQAVRTLNRKLSEYHNEILSTITAKEILNAKIKIHDELGAGLLSIKRFLQTGGTDDDKKMILSTISGSIDYLKRESETTQEDEYELMLNTAKALGVDVCVNGILPAENPGKHIIATAIHECFTNTLRHANGDRLMIDMSEKEGYLCAVFTNNGDQPKEEISERGGLSSLRKLTQEAHGSMEISIERRFSLTILIPKEAEGYGLQGFDC